MQYASILLQISIFSSLTAGGTEYVYFSQYGYYMFVFGHLAVPLPVTPPHPLTVDVNKSHKSKHLFTPTRDW